MSQLEGGGVVGATDGIEEPVIPGMPRPMRWMGLPESWALGPDGRLAIRAGARTDWFVDPEDGRLTRNAPALLMAASGPRSGPWMLSARASAEHRSAFDAAVLVVNASDRVWAKLCLERSAAGPVKIVSVVTRGGSSDDCDSVAVPEGVCWLRIARLANAYAFHCSEDGRSWTMVRYFAFDDGPSESEVGFLAQSPTGDGCTATFESISFSSTLLGDVRSGE
jgi:uncharacterized protein